MATVHLCQYSNCEQEATAGRFGRTYCEEHQTLIENQREAEKEAKQAEKSEARERRRAQAPVSRGSLRGQIRDAVLMTAAVAAVKDPNIYMAVEATVDEFATAWDNVAKQSPSARKYIVGLLNGGVWISAFGATVVMVVTTLAVTGSLPENLHPLGHFCVDHAGLQVQPVSTNGGGPSGVESPAAL